MSYVNSFAKLAVLRRERDGICDAVLALKLDPAVLDAQVSTENSKCSQAKTGNLKNENKNMNDFRFNSWLDKAIFMHLAAPSSLPTRQCKYPMYNVDTINQLRMMLQRNTECGYCKNWGHPDIWYKTHAVRDREGRVMCPLLRSVRCRVCGATGDYAHTEEMP